MLELTPKKKKLIINFFMSNLIQFIKYNKKIRGDITITKKIKIVLYSS